MNNPIIYQVGGGLAVIAFLVILFFCARTWRIWHVLFTFAVFGCAIWFCILASISLKTRRTFRLQYEQLKEQKQTLDAEYYTLLHGDLDDPKDEKLSIRSIRGQIKRELTGRGRVWRSCSPTGAPTAQSITLDTTGAAAAAPAPAPAPDGAGGAPAAPAGIADNQLQDQDVLYAFLERKSPLGPEPWLYLGEYTTTNVTPTTVTLTPLVPLDNVQVAQVNNWNGASWALYEVLPIDSHKTYALDPEYQQDLDEEGSTLFGEFDDALRNQLTAPGRDLYRQQRQRDLAALADPAQKQMMQKIVDRMEANFALTDQQYQADGKVVAAPQETSWAPEDLWVKVRFQKDYSVDVDAGANLDAIKTDSYFDIEGRAQIESVQAGSRDEDGKFIPKPTEFSPDDVAVFDAATADQLIRDGVCVQVDTVYVRPTFDFGRAFHEHARRLVNLNFDIKMANRDNQNILANNASMKERIDKFTGQRDSLNNDLDAVKAEVKAATAYRDLAQNELNQLKSKMSNMYRRIQDLAEQLTAINEQMLKDHNSKSRVASSR